METIAVARRTAVALAALIVTLAAMACGEGSSSANDGGGAGGDGGGGGDGGTGGTDAGLCARMCAHVYRDCRVSFGDPEGNAISEEACVDACEADLIPGVACLAETACTQAALDACIPQGASCEEACGRVYECGLEFYASGARPIDEATCVQACNRGALDPEDRTCFAQIECDPHDYYRCVVGGEVTPACEAACIQLVDVCDLWLDQNLYTQAACRQSCMELWPEALVACFNESACGGIQGCLEAHR